MSQTNAIARPYAKAAFEYAMQHKTFSEWSAMLASASAVVNDKQVFRLFADPRMSTQKMAEFILKICQKVMVPATTNFIRLLAENKRLKVLPEIASLFEVLRNEYERKIDVEVVSAHPLGETDQKRLSEAL